MKKWLVILTIGNFFFWVAVHAQDKRYANKIPSAGVMSLNGPFTHGRDISIQTLLKYNLSPSLTPYYNEAGLAKNRSGDKDRQGPGEHVLMLADEHAKSAMAETNDQETLKEVYKNAFLIGTAVTPDITSGKDKALQEIVINHFNSITVENVMKAALINPRPGIYNFGPADDFVAFGEKNKMFMVAHTLVWHNQVPAWFFTNAAGKPNTKEEQIERLRSHIQAVAGRYAGRVHAWDVVNEVIDDDGRYRPTSWVNAFGNGDTLVKYAFMFAAQYDPGTELYYNDFNAWRPSKRDGIVRMIKMLQKEGIRIDGVGMQGHWGLNYPKTQYIEEAVDAYAACGIKVMITELDVDVLPLTKEGQIIGQGMADKQFQLEEFKTFLDPYQNGLPDSMQMMLAKRYEELFSVFYKRKDKIARVTLWGIHDGMSWKNDYPIPGRTNYPLLWDRQRKPKPALQAVLRVPSGPAD